MENDCIFALSSGGLPSGVAVVRVSGPNLETSLSSFLEGEFPKAGAFKLRTIVNPLDGQIIDHGLVSAFTAPHSFTGEDCFEFQVHGGPAVVEKLLKCLGELDGFRLAEAGEFSKRAFENGKLDLTEIEGLSDLLAAETEEQRKLAVAQSGGALRRRLEGWRSMIVRSRAFIEAELDFADEDDVPGSVSDQVWNDVNHLMSEVESFINDGNRGEIVRRGYKIALMGLPNAGKSSLLNALSKRDIAIVSDEAGTTRDVLEVSLNIDGYEVIFFDTAGIRLSDSAVEIEGIKRAKAAGEGADLVFWLHENREFDVDSSIAGEVVCIRTKMDDALDGTSDGLFCSVKRLNGLDGVLNFIRKKLSSSVGDGSAGLITRHRHRQHLIDTVCHLREASANPDKDISLRSEDLRLAGECLGKITGRIDVEDLLDLIFSEFCIGK